MTRRLNTHFGSSKINNLTFLSKRINSKMHYEDEGPRGDGCPCGDGLGIQSVTTPIHTMGVVAGD